MYTAIMPKKSKAKKNGTGRGGAPQSFKPLSIAEDDQEYGIVIKTLGDCHFTVTCQDGKERLCRVRGKMKKKQYVRDGDVVLITKREFEDNKADIIDVYNAENVRALRREGYLKIGMDDNGAVKQERDEVESDEDHKDDESFDFAAI